MGVPNLIPSQAQRHRQGQWQPSSSSGSQVPQGQLRVSRPCPPSPGSHWSTAPTPIPWLAFRLAKHIMLILNINIKATVIFFPLEMQANVAITFGRCKWSLWHWGMKMLSTVLGKAVCPGNSSVYLPHSLPLLNVNSLWIRLSSSASAFTFLLSIIFLQIKNMMRPFVTIWGNDSLGKRELPSPVPETLAFRFIVQASKKRPPIHLLMVSLITTFKPGKEGTKCFTYREGLRTWQTHLTIFYYRIFSATHFCLFASWATYTLNTPESRPLVCLGRQLQTSALAAPWVISRKMQGALILSENTMDSLQGDVQGPPRIRSHLTFFSLPLARGLLLSYLDLFAHMVPEAWNVSRAPTHPTGSALARSSLY